MKVIVGLGNPGRKYCHNRHNVGHMVVDRIARDSNVLFKRSLLKKAWIAKMSMADQSVYLAKSLTFMNNSGNTVAKILCSYRISPDNCLIVYDDMDIELGRMKFARKGSSGGHNGVYSVIEALGTDRIQRLRIGISRPPKGDPVEYVLEDFEGQQRDAVEDVVCQASIACRDWLLSGIEYVMQKYNQRK